MEQVLGQPADTRNIKTWLAHDELEKRILHEEGFELIAKPVLKYGPYYYKSSSTSDESDNREAFYILAKDGVNYLVRIGETWTTNAGQPAFSWYHAPLIIGTLSKENIPEGLFCQLNFIVAERRPGGSKFADKVEPLDDSVRKTIKEQLQRIFDGKIKPEVRQLYGLPAQTG